MYQKILEQLKAKHAGVPTALLERVAKKLSETVTEESAIQSAVDGLDAMPIPITEFAGILQSEGDRRVSEALKKVQTKPDPAKPDPAKPNPDPANPNPGGDETSSMLKTLLEKVERLEKEKTFQSYNDKLMAAMKEKKIPIQLAKNRVIESDEQFDQVIADIEKDFNEMKSDLAQKGLLNLKPENSTGGNLTDKNVKSAIEGWAKDSQPPKAVETAK
jgi:hypothetical protein